MRTDDRCPSNSVAPQGDNGRSLTIRPVRPAEYETVADLIVRAYVGGAHLDGGEAYVGVLRDTADRAALAEVLVAVDGDTVLGTVTISERGGKYVNLARPGELEFRMLAVEPESAGRGVGRALVGRVIERARELGLRRVVLSSQRSMTTAHGLYRALGFERTPDRDWQPVPGSWLLTFALELAPRVGTGGRDSDGT